MSSAAVPLTKYTLQALIALLQSSSSSALDANTETHTGQWIGDVLLADALPHSWQHSNFEEINTRGFTQRFDMVVIVLPLLANLEAVHRNVITKARDILAHKLLLIQPSSKHDFALAQDLRSLALSAITDVSLLCDSQTYRVWQYNIVNYKQVPDWLNSKFWANPENWNKYRW